MPRVLLHCDMNNFFASVECLYNPALRKGPMVVTGDPQLRHGIVLARNDSAKALGIIAGESIYEARRKSPELQIIPANYRRYISFAKKAREIYNETGTDIVPYGLDEAWVDVSQRAGGIGEGREIADCLRRRVRTELGLTLSVGVSYNYVFSKLASDMKKPDATTALSEGDYADVICRRPAFELLFVGPATRRRLAALNILTIGDLAGADPAMLRREFGVPGLNLWQFANGNDSSFDPHLPEDEPMKSFGNTITLPQDISGSFEVYAMLLALARAVAGRLERHERSARCVTIRIRYHDFTAFSRQETLPEALRSPEMIFFCAKRLFDRHRDPARAVRSVGISLSALEKPGNEQLTWLPPEDLIPDDVTRLIPRLASRIEGVRVDASMQEDSL